MSSERAGLNDEVGVLLLDFLSFYDTLYCLIHYSHSPMKLFYSRKITTRVMKKCDWYSKIHFLPSQGHFSQTRVKMGCIKKWLKMQLMVETLFKIHVRRAASHLCVSVRRLLATTKKDTDLKFSTYTLLDQQTISKTGFFCIFRKSDPEGRQPKKTGG